MCEEADDEEQKYISVKDFMNDFATEDFLKLNIRVRPVSGMTRGDYDGGATADANDSDKKYQEDCRFEDTNERKRVKDAQREYQKRKEQEEAEKARKRRQ